MKYVFPTAGAGIVLALIFSSEANAANNRNEVDGYDAEFEEILSLDIADLTVTSVSKREQKLTDAPAAVYVITQEDMHRAGVTSIPEALRMVPGVEVAQTASNQWAVSARGFNNTLADKLLVMIDGRSIYTPVFSGTYWDDQSTLIEDIDRIEVIRGPGASLWGANAVDGIINIITKKAAATQGDYFSAGIGNEENFTEARHGGKIDKDTYYRTYAQYSAYGGTENETTGQNDFDRWYRGRSGFRVDGAGTGKDTYTVQGDVYDGQEQSDLTLPVPTSPFSQEFRDDGTSYGGNILARWNHEISNDSHTSLQAYFDDYSRLEITAKQHVNTGDVQFQQNLRADDRNNVVWGTGARVYAEDLVGTFAASVPDRYSYHDILNAFAQDEYALVPDKVYATLGSKFEYNDYTGFEVEPSARIAWYPTTKQTVWAAISRAVRIPSVIEESANLVAGVVPGSPPNVLEAVGNTSQVSEKLIAYEVGHRIQPTHSLSLDTALYYNQFSDLSTYSNPGTPVLEDGLLVTPFSASNLGSGHVYGAEEAANWNITPAWRVSGSYTLMKMELESAPSAVVNLQSMDSLAPRNQFSARSYWNITDALEWDNMVYYVSAITPPVDSYVRYDTRIGWKVEPGVELSLTGRNLLDSAHAEFPTVPQTEIKRSVLARITLKF